MSVVQPACSPTVSWKPIGRMSFPRLKYQMGEGCISDQILGQWHAEVAGIGGFLDAEKVKTALKSVHREQFPPDIGEPFQSLPQLRL